MSCYEWEHGEIKLPSAEFTKVFKAALSAAQAHQLQIIDKVNQFWKECPPKFKRTTKRERYWAAVQAFCFGNNDFYDHEKRAYAADPEFPAWRGLPGDRHGLSSDVYSVLTGAIRPCGGRPPRRINDSNHAVRPTQAYIKERFPATNRTTRFGDGEWLLTFDREKRTVVWAVAENNHARDYGRTHPVAQAFFQALDKVKWTRGTGGQIVGNDEYNRDDVYAGGGANYVVDEYGPKVKRQPAHMFR